VTLSQAAKRECEALAIDLAEQRVALTAPLVAMVAEVALAKSDSAQLTAAAEALQVGLRCL
jgi:hypothetical protein